MDSVGLLCFFSKSIRPLESKLRCACPHAPAFRRTVQQLGEAVEVYRHGLIVLPSSRQGRISCRDQSSNIFRSYRSASP